jgi:hypothetical protein
VARRLSKFAEVLEERKDVRLAAVPANHMVSVFARHTRSPSGQDSETLRLMARLRGGSMDFVPEKLKRQRCPDVT